MVTASTMTNKRENMTAEDYSSFWVWKRQINFRAKHAKGKRNKKIKFIIEDQKHNHVNKSYVVLSLIYSTK